MGVPELAIEAPDKVRRKNLARVAQNCEICTVPEGILRQNLITRRAGIELHGLAI
jgi:hypothetical protein